MSPVNQSLCDFNIEHDGSTPKQDSPQTETVDEMLEHHLKTTLTHIHITHE
jgi:hypothetical protein